MPDETWHDIYSGRGESPRVPVAPRLVIPRVARPEHPKHCGDRHGTDGWVACPHCQVPAYQVVTHEWFHMSGHYWHSLEPMNGSPPKTDSTTPVCNCGRTMVRKWI